MDLSSDYLPGSFEQVTVTGMSNLLDGALSHDKITRLLSDNKYFPVLFSAVNNGKRLRLFHSLFREAS
jgi:hypothetical protein